MCAGWERTVPDAARFLAQAAAILLLNASLTFDNWWPTPFVRWSGAPSVELAVLLVGLAAASLWLPLAQSKRLLRWLSVAWLVLVIGRYADVTAPALWGRELNFYWDLDRKSTRLNCSHVSESRMPSSA